MQKDNIKNFVDGWKQYDGDKNPVATAWLTRFRDAGYFSVNVSINYPTKWPEMHSWCKEQFGKEHYTWTGSMFWFEKSQDAAFFTLRWA